MDWNLAIERNREALKRILAMLVAMAGAEAFTGGGRREASGCDAEDTPSRRPDDRRALTLPRHLHRAILRLLRPAESAVRRLVIVMARGLVVTLPAPRPRKAKPASIFLRKPGGTGILMPRGYRPSARPAPRALALPLLDPLRRSVRLRRPVASGIPRISLPGVIAPSHITPRRPPAPDDPLDATRLALRLRALGAALDDLPAQARRFARWKAARAAGRAAAGAQNQNPAAAGAQNQNPAAAGAQNQNPDAAGAQKKNQRTRRVWPLRPGRPPGQRPARRPAHEVHEILNDLHGLAFDVLEHPDTS